MASFSNSALSRMLNFVVFLSALLLAISTNHTEVDAEPVDPLFPICKTAGGGSPYFDVNFCMSALESDSRSHDAGNYQDLSVIVVDLITANATSTAAKIDGLLKKGGGDATVQQQGLLSCQVLYKGIVESQPSCAAAVKGGRFSEATSSLEWTASAAKQCEDVFGRTKVASPLTVEDDSEFKLAKLAVALLTV